MFQTKFSLGSDSTFLYENLDLVKRTPEQNEMPLRKISTLLFAISANNVFGDFGRAIFCDVFANEDDLFNISFTNQVTFFSATSNFRDSKSQK